MHRNHPAHLSNSNKSKNYITVVIKSFLFLIACVFVYFAVDSTSHAQVLPPDVPDIKLTGVNDSGAKLPGNRSDPHWRITDFYNDVNRPTCQDETPRQATTVNEYDFSNNVVANGSRAGQYFGQIAGEWAPWEFTSTNARWIGQNQYGRSDGDGNGNQPNSWTDWCYDPGYVGGNPSPNVPPWNGKQTGVGGVSDSLPDLPSNGGDPSSWPLWNTYVFSYNISTPLRIDTTKFNLDSIRIVMRGMADNFVGIRINGIPMDIDCGANGDGDNFPTAATGPVGNKVPMCLTGFGANAQTFTASVDTSRPNPFLVHSNGEIHSFEILIKSGFSNNGFILTDIEWFGSPPNVPAICGTVSIAPANPEPDEPFRITVSVLAGTQTPGPGRIIFNGSTFNVTYSNSGSNTYTASVNNRTYPTAGNPTVRWTAGRAGTTDRDNLLNNCSGTIPISQKPYLRVFGNDVMAGSYFASGTDCTAPTPTSAGIYTFGHNVSFYRTGSGTQLAAFATGEIREFISASNRYAGFHGAANSPSGLTFSNNPKPPGTDGGNSGIKRCVPDYFSSDPKVSSSTVTTNADQSLAPLVTGQTYSSGAHVRFIDGDAYIVGNIAINTAGAANASQLPSFHLVVKGDIYIQNTVTRLDGVYIAQPRDDGSGGRIFTCARNVGFLQPLVLYATSAIFANCNRQLDINGAFIAKEVRFLRSYQTRRRADLNETASSTLAAESFNFSPEIYLAPQPTVFSRLRGSSVSRDYDSIINLPPIL